MSGIIIVEDSTVHTMNHRISITALAAVSLLASCSYCWPSLHTAEAVLHCDKQVVVRIPETLNTKYRYKGKDWYPIKLAYATDKGKNIYRRGAGAGWCPEDNAERYQIQQETVRTCMVPAETRNHPHDYSLRVLRYDLAMAEKDFPFRHAKRLNIAKEENLPRDTVGVGFSIPYSEITTPVAGMPITEAAPQPTTGQHLAAVPLEVFDTTATIALCTAEQAAILAILPVAAVCNVVGKIAECFR